MKELKENWWVFVVLAWAVGSGYFGPFKSSYLLRFVVAFVLVLICTAIESYWNRRSREKNTEP